MPYHPRFECKKVASFQTTRTRNSQLWFVNNSNLEKTVLGYAARYATRYSVRLYALAIEGNHIQHVAHFPECNRAHFMRDFNSSVARAVPRFQSNYPGGSLWQRRYSAEYLPGDSDIEDRFFYTVLQPVNDGLVDDIRDYPGYNCFEDAINGTLRQFTVVKWKEYNDARRWNPYVSIEQYTETHTLQYARLPGYEALSQKQYTRIMREKLKYRTAAALKKRANKPAFGRQNLIKIVPGSRPKSTKTSARYQHRPRVLSKDPARRAAGESWYFSRYFEYRRASRRYRTGELNTPFPAGTYRPPLFTVGYTGTIG